MPDKQNVVLIDSGRYESPELFEWIKQEKLTIRSVIHTHLHIDHIANSADLNSLCGTVLYSSENEPLESYVGFRTKTDFCRQHPDFRLVPIPGHSPGHQMVITPDNVGFAGDAILTEDFLQRTIIPYMEYIKLSIQSMRKIKRAGLDACVCSHNGIVESDDINQIVDLNIQKEYDLFELLEETLVRPMSRLQLIDLFMQNAGIWNRQIRQYDYMMDTVSYRIDELIEEKRFIEKNGLICPL